MKQGTLHVQNRSKAAKVKGGAMVLLMAALWATTFLPRSDIFALTVLVLGAVAAKWMTAAARKGGWFFLDVDWTVTEETVTIGALTLPRKEITKVMCMPQASIKRKGLGGWVLQVETWKDLHRWHSRTQSGNDQQSIQSMQALASALDSQYMPWKP